ncbi:hypothetical protein KAR91_31235 [Candidatus Pacearchaeota archaeon]|nr:hypothetical protein [Candidatus Pacearchaeota archaeon]
MHSYINIIVVVLIVFFIALLFLIRFMFYKRYKKNKKKTERIKEINGIKKCSIVNRMITPCDELALSFKSGIDKKSGVEFCALLKKGSKKARAQFVVLKSGKYKKRGTIIHYCPFCGVNISKHMPRPEGKW